MKIDAVFMLRGRGLVVVGRLDPTASCKVGDKVVVAKPGGHTEYCTTIRGIEMGTSSWSGRAAQIVGVMLADLTKDEVAAQDEIYLLEGIAKESQVACKEADAHSEA